MKQSDESTHVSVPLPRLLLLGRTNTECEALETLLRTQLDSSLLLELRHGTFGVWETQLTCSEFSDTTELILAVDAPEWDLFKLLSQLAKLSAAIPVLVLGEETSVDRVLALMRSGISDYLTPTRTNELGAILTAELARAQARRLERQENDTARLLARACHAAGRPIVIADARRTDRPLIFANKAFEKLTGYLAAEVLGKNCRFLEGPEGSREGHPAIRKALDRGERCEETLRNFRKNGTLFYNHFIIEPMRDENDVLTHFVGVQSDETEIKMNEERFRRSFHYEQEMNQMKTDFVTMVSHEFRTPLGVINTAAHILARYADKMGAAERVEQVHEIQNAVTRMTTMMEDLLLFGKFEARKLKCRISLVDVGALCRELIHELKKQGEESRSIECSIENSICLLQLDQTLLRHILSNLLGNALKYSSPNRDVLLELRLEAAAFHQDDTGETPPRDQLIIIVQDSGIGIPAAELPKLFQPFHRSANVGNRPGTGMGLAITKHCVDLHGGTIRVESIEGQGTCFRVSLPLGSIDAPCETKSLSTSESLQSPATAEA